MSAPDRAAIEAEAERRVRNGIDLTYDMEYDAFVLGAEWMRDAMLDWFDGVRAVIEREHPVELWTDYSNAEHGPIEDRTGCPTCRTDGPCATRRDILGPAS
jgi:hypothetical protein